MYYDPDDLDPLEAEKASLPVAVQRRMVAIEAAMKAMDMFASAAGPTDTAEDVLAMVFGFADHIEARIVERERPWELATMPYADYLQTPEWQAKRERARDRAGGRCQVCDSEGPLDVHHRTYERRGNERDEDLTVLCRGCHELFSRTGRLR
jgi:hypothetical protein